MDKDTVERLRRIQSLVFRGTGMFFVVATLVMGWRFVTQPGLLIMPALPAAQTVPTAGYRLYTWHGGLQVLVVGDGPAMRDNCDSGWVDRYEVYRCWFVFADDTVVRWLLWSADGRSGWVEVNGERYQVPGEGNIVRIRADGARGAITLLHRDLPTIAPNEAVRLEHWMATDPEFADVAEAFAAARNP